MINKLPVVNPISIIGKSDSRKIFDFLIILHNTGRPVYSKFTSNISTNFQNQIFYSGLLSAIMNYSKYLGSDYILSSINFTNSRIFFYYGEIDLIFVLSLKKNSLKVNKEYALVKEFIKKLDSFFSKELDSMEDWSVLNINTQLSIESKIDSITNYMLKKEHLTFFF